MYKLNGEDLCKTCLTQSDDDHVFFLMFQSILTTSGWAYAVWCSLVFVFFAFLLPLAAVIGTPSWVLTPKTTQPPPCFQGQMRNPSLFFGLHLPIRSSYHSPSLPRPLGRRSYWPSIWMKISPCGPGWVPSTMRRCSFFFVTVFWGNDEWHWMAMVHIPYKYINI